MLSLIGRVLSGRYRIDEYINKGGMSYIYKAWDIVTEQYYAIKVLKEEYATNDEYVKRFNYEALAASQMRHPNIVYILDVGIEGAIRYLVLELVEGKTLKDIIKEKGIIDYDKACEISIRVLSALSHAHKKNIVHRDIKPQNILVDVQGNIKISDFGIARIANVPTLTQTNIGLGTIQYVSPEQAQGKNTDSTSDIYSMGIVMYEMLTGRLPFDGDNAANVILKQMNEEAENISRINPRVPQEISAVVAVAMQKDPQKRYTTAYDMVQDIKRAMNGYFPDKAKEIIKENAEREKLSELNKINVVANNSNKVNLGNKTNSQAKQRQKFIRSFIFVSIFVAILISMTFWGINWVSQVTRLVYAPDVEGLKIDDAINVLESFDLKPQTNQVYHKTVEANKVISQIPIPQTKMYRGDNIVLNISLGKENLICPDLKGLNQNEGLEKASSVGFTISIVEKVVSSDIAKGLIVSQSPEAGKAINIGDVVQVKISGGSAVIPNLTGLTQEDAIKHLEGMDLQCGEISFKEVIDENQNNKVLSQSPEKATMVVAGTKVELSIGILVSDHISSATFTLPKIDKSFLIRVSLILPNAEEKSQFIAMHSPTNSAETTITVPLRAKEEGSMYCNLYINDVLYDTIEVNLK